MNKGIEIILARMESNPEEFANEHYRTVNTAGTGRTAKEVYWLKVIANLAAKVEGAKREADKSSTPSHPPLDPYGFLSVEEATQVLNKYHELQGENFTNGVMEILLREEQPSFSDSVYSQTARQANQALNQRMLGSLQDQGYAGMGQAPVKYEEGGLIGILREGVAPTPALESAWDKVFGRNK